MSRLGDLRYSFYSGLHRETDDRSEASSMSEPASPCSSTEAYSLIVHCAYCLLGHGFRLASEHSIARDTVIPSVGSQCKAVRYSVMSSTFSLFWPHLECCLSPLYSVFDSISVHTRSAACSSRSHHCFCCVSDLPCRFISLSFDLSFESLGVGSRSFFDFSSDLYLVSLLTLYARAGLIAQS